tara:strand:+ start:413 stop:586 length:174 start_codon:yes stop_codon:yes gene_type:complete
MNVESAQYKVDVDGTTKTGIKATIDGIDCAIPLNPANRHYQAILEWVAAGNKIEEAD